MFDEWYALYDRTGEGFRQKRERTRASRVARMFERMRR